MVGMMFKEYSSLIILNKMIKNYFLFKQFVWKSRTFKVIKTPHLDGYICQVVGFYKWNDYLSVISKLKQCTFTIPANQYQ